MKMLRAMVSIVCTYLETLAGLKGKCKSNFRLYDQVHRRFKYSDSELLLFKIIHLIVAWYCPGCFSADYMC